MNEHEVAAFAEIALHEDPDWSLAVALAYGRMFPDDPAVVALHAALDALKDCQP